MKERQYILKEGQRIGKFCSDKTSGRSDNSFDLRPKLQVRRAVAHGNLLSSRISFILYGMTETQKCPICSADVPYSERYPRYVCNSCHTRATDENGRSLRFSNVSLSGGFAAIYADTREERNDHVCYIDRIRCRADEARFGGIVIQPEDE